MRELDDEQKAFLDRIERYAFPLDKRFIPNDWEDAHDFDEKYRSAEEAHGQKQRSADAAEQKKRRIAEKASIRKLTAANFEKQLLPYLKGTAEAVKGYVTEKAAQPIQKLSEELEGLQQKVADLESRQLKYLGVWNDDTFYPRGSVLTHSGSLWHCDIGNAGVAPGKSPEHWTLCVKRGRDAR